jgi:hypothetical protein
MANWKHEVKLKDVWNEHTPANIIARTMRERVLAIVAKDERFSDDELQDILDDLDDLAGGTSMDELMECYDRLCDWGDEDHRLFVNTLFDIETSDEV